MDARSFSDNALKQRTVLQAQRGAANYYTDITQEICRLCPLTKWQLAEHSSAKQAGILGVGICVAVSEGVCVCVHTLEPEVVCGHLLYTWPAITRF